MPCRQTGAASCAWAVVTQSGKGSRRPARTTRADVSRERRFMKILRRTSSPRKERLAAMLCGFGLGGQGRGRYDNKLNRLLRGTEVSATGSQRHFNTQRGAEKLSGASPKVSSVQQCRDLSGGRDQSCRSTRADRQSAAGAKGEVGLLLRRAGRDFQRLVGHFEGEDVLFELFKSHRGVLHGIILSFASGAGSQTYLIKTPLPSAISHDPMQSLQSQLE